MNPHLPVVLAGLLGVASLGVGEGVVVGRPDDTYMDLRTNVVYEWREGRLAPLGVGMAYDFRGVEVYEYGQPIRPEHTTGWSGEVCATVEDPSRDEQPPLAKKCMPRPVPAGVCPNGLVGNCYAEEPAQICLHDACIRGFVYATGAYYAWMRFEYCDVGSPCVQSRTGAVEGGPEVTAGRFAQEIETERHHGTIRACVVVAHRTETGFPTSLVSSHSCKEGTYGLYHSLIRGGCYRVDHDVPNECKVREYSPPWLDPRRDLIEGQCGPLVCLGGLP